MRSLHGLSDDLLSARDHAGASRAVSAVHDLPAGLLQSVRRECVLARRVLSVYRDFGVFVESRGSDGQFGRFVLHGPAADERSGGNHAVDKLADLSDSLDSVDVQPRGHDTESGAFAGHRQPVSGLAATAHF